MHELRRKMILVPEMGTEHIMNENLGGRIKWIDVAKALCILSIVLGHTLKSSYLRTYTLSYDVPMFFFLSGCCFKYTSDLLRALIKKVKTIVVPYIFFSLLSIAAFWSVSLVYPKVTSIMDCNALRNICVMLYGNSKPDVMKYNSPLWFLSCFFVVSILSNCVEKIIAKNNRGGVCRLFVLSVSVIFNVLVTTLPTGLILPWHFETALSMLFWYELGICFQKSTMLNRLNEERNSLKFLLTAILACVVGIVAAFANFNVVKTSLQVRQDEYGVTLLYYLAALGGIIFMCHLAIYLQNFNWLQALGRNTLVVLCLHKFPVLFFQEILPFTKNLLLGGNSVSAVLTACFVTIISTLLSLAAGWFISRICPHVIKIK